MRYYILFFVVSVAAKCLGQGYHQGLNPSSMEWREIELDAARIIYLEGGEQQAQRVANLVDRMSTESAFSLGSKIRKVPIILHNQTLSNNGFVTVSPWRSEFYVHGPQNNFAGAVDWLDMLTIHEYRHIQQFQNSNKGITRLFGVFFGQNGWGGSTVLALPNWFLEGDAVFYETIATPSGRGRMPQFENQFKAMLLADRRYTYEKARGISFKEFVPNHYGLGYFMTTSLRNQFGEGIWEELLDQSVRYDGIIYPLSRNMKKRTGMRTPQLFRKTFSDLDSEWEEEISQKALTSSEKLLGRDKRGFTNYRNATFLNDSTIIFEMSGFSRIPSYYLYDISTGQIEKIVEPGFYSTANATISVANRRLLWAENSFDERWANQDYSVIMSYELDRRSKTIHTFKSKYLAPDLHQSGRRAVAVNYKEDGSQELHIIQLENGNVSEHIAHPDDLQFSFPKWHNDDIIVIGKKSDQNALFRYRSDGSWQQLTPYFYELINYPKPYKDMIFFGGIFSGTDEIYAVRDGSIYQVTSSQFGATQVEVSPDGSNLYYSEYTANGYQLMQASFNPGDWRVLDISAIATPEYFSGLQTLDFKDQEDQQYESMPYGGSFSIHSWSPLVSGGFGDSQIPNIGAGIYFDNAISTLSGEVSAIYNRNENAMTYDFSMEYGKFYPVFGLDIKRAKRDRYIPVTIEEEGVNNDGNAIALVSLPLRIQQWNESKAGVSVLFPWNLTTGNFYGRFWAKGLYEQIWVDYFDDDLGVNGTFGALGSDFTLSFLKRQAYQHVNPRWGIQSQFTYRSTLGVEFNKSSYFQSSNFLFFPGLSRNHSVYLDMNFGLEPFNAAYKFEDIFRYPRGYGAQPHDFMAKYGLNYKFPLLYPDLALGPVIFLKRVVVNLFFDYADYTIKSRDIDDYTPIGRVSSRGRFDALSGQYRSFGSEVTFDFKLLRLTDVSLGFRYSHLLDNVPGESTDQFDFLLVYIDL